MKEKIKMWIKPILFMAGGAFVGLVYYYYVLVLVNYVKGDILGLCLIGHGVGQCQLDLLAGAQNVVFLDRLAAYRHSSLVAKTRHGRAGQRRLN